MKRLLWNVNTRGLRKYNTVETLVGLAEPHRYLRVQACAIYQPCVKISFKKIQLLRRVAAIFDLSKYKFHLLERNSVFTHQFHICIAYCSLVKRSKIECWWSFMIGYPFFLIFFLVLILKMWEPNCICARVRLSFFIINKAFRFSQTIFQPIFFKTKLARCKYIYQELSLFERDVRHFNTSYIFFIETRVFYNFLCRLVRSQGDW